MKRALLMYWHGLGDVIQLTPHLRYLYQEGFMVDLLCRPEVRTSNLLRYCPYINKLIDVPNPWQSAKGKNNQIQSNNKTFEALRSSYQWSGKSLHNTGGACKIDTTSRELGLQITDKKLEVFISKEAEQEALCVKNNFPDGYIFVHTMIENHKYHNWNSSNFIAKNYTDVDIIDTGYEGDFYKKFSDIGVSFVLSRDAKARILSSSVFVHACDAMNVCIDVINYGRPDRKVWPLDQSKVMKIRESNKWIKL